MPNRSLVPGWIQTQNDNTNYGYQGFNPELAAEAQALNRKQQMANALLQQGMTAPQGQMVGRRFYVPPAWSQYLDQAGSSILGAVLTNKFDRDRQSLEDRNKQQKADLTKRILRGMIGEEGQIVEGPRPQGQEPIMSQMQGPLPAVTEPTESVPFEHLDPAMMGTKVPFDMFATIGSTPSPGMTPQANAYAGYLRGNEAPEGSPDPLGAASINQRIGEMAAALYPPPPPTMPLRDSERFATAPIETQAPMRELEETFRPTGISGYAPAEAQGPGASLKTPDIPATPETQMQAMVEAAASGDPGLLKLASFIQGSKQHEQDAAAKAAQHEADMKARAAQHEADAAARAAENEKNRNQRTEDKREADERHAELQRQLAKERADLQREMHNTASANAQLMAQTSLTGASIAHEDKLAQLEQNRRHDEELLEMKRGQFKSEEEFKKAQLANEKRHQEAVERENVRWHNMEKTIRESQAKENKPPPGYRQTPDGNLEAIPGGPADLKQQGALNADTASMEGATASLDRLATSANELLNHPGLAGITGLRGALPNIPGSQAANAQALLDTLKSKVGFGVLQEMRNQSKTGGALGQVTERELAFLQNNLETLANSQDIDQMQKSLKGILQYVEDAKGRIRNAYNMKHKGQAPAVAPSAPLAPPAAAPDLKSLLEKYK